MGTHHFDYAQRLRQDENSQLALDDWHRREVVELAKQLDPIQNKIMGAILGNHYWQFSDGTNSEQYLCQLLKVPYLGPTGIARVEFRDKGGKGTVRHHLVIWAHHSGGSAGGRTAGGDVNAMMRAEGSFDADVYLLSHTHRRYATREPVLTLSPRGMPRVVERPRVFVRTGAFLKGYAEDFPTTNTPHFPSYAENKAYRPTDLGWVSVGISFSYTRPKRSGGRVDPIRPEFTLTY